MVLRATPGDSQSNTQSKRHLHCNPGLQEHLASRPPPFKQAIIQFMSQCAQIQFSATSLNIISGYFYGMLTISPLASITIAWFIWHQLNTVSTIHSVDLRPIFLWFGRAPSSSHAFQWWTVIQDLATTFESVCICLSGQGSKLCSVFPQRASGCWTSNEF